MSTPEVAFMAAIERATAALAEAERLWDSHPEAIDTLVANAPYPAGLPSFDEFVLAFAEWSKAVSTWRNSSGASDRLLCLRRLEGHAARAVAVQPPPFGPGWGAATAAQITRLEVWGTTFGSPEDFCEFRGFAGDMPVATAHLPGY